MVPWHHLCERERHSFLPQQGRCTGLRSDQWHKTSWSHARAGHMLKPNSVTFAGTTGQYGTHIFPSSPSLCNPPVLATNLHSPIRVFCQEAPQWGAADAEIKVPSGENTELKRSPFQAWSRSVYSHICCAYCQGVLPCLFLPFQPIHLHFLSKPLPIFSCVGLQNKIGHPA